MSAASSAEPGGAAAAAAAAAGAEPKSSRLADEGDMFFSVKKWDCVVSWMFGREGDQNLQDCAICKNALTEPSVTYETDPCETVRLRARGGACFVFRARISTLAHRVPRSARLAPRISRSPCDVRPPHSAVR